MPASNDNTSSVASAPALRWLRQHLPHIALVLGATGVAALLGYGLTLSLLPLLSGKAALAGAVVGAALTAIGLPVALWMRVPQQAYLRLLRQQGVADAAARQGAPSRSPSAGGSGTADGFGASRSPGAVVTRLRPAPADRSAAAGLDAHDGAPLAARSALSPAAAAAAAMPSGMPRAAAGHTAADAPSDFSVPMRLDGRTQSVPSGSGSGSAGDGHAPRAPRADEFPVFQPLGLAGSVAGAPPAGPSGERRGDPRDGAGSDPGMSPLPALPGGGVLPAMAEGISDAQRSVRDALTGAYTQQHFVAAADREWSRIRRHGEDAALLMIDIDRFKGINDRFGQGCGDALLIEVTRQVSNTLRQYDLMARFGGGVLVVYLPHTDPIGALDVAERIRERIATLRVHWEQHTVRSTVSVGVAGIGASHGALDEVIADAGTALRDAKAAGRNCVRAAPIPPRRRADSFPVGSQRPLGPH